MGPNPALEGLSWSPPPHILSMKERIEEEAPECVWACVVHAAAADEEKVIVAKADSDFLVAEASSVYELNAESNSCSLAHFGRHWSENRPCQNLVN